MHLETITLETWADLNDRMDIRHRHDDGTTLTVTGHHPELGAVVIVQTIDGVALVSEVPVSALSH
ncbi:hypothetical protein [Alsobacter sp. R-9]